jgi:hypothetical protein
MNGVVALQDSVVRKTCGRRIWADAAIAPSKTAVTSAEDERVFFQAEAEHGMMRFQEA